MLAFPRNILDPLSFTSYPKWPGPSGRETMRFQCPSMPITRINPPCVSLDRSLPLARSVSSLIPTTCELPRRLSSMDFGHGELEAEGSTVAHASITHLR